MEQVSTIEEELRRLAEQPPTVEIAVQGFRLSIRAMHKVLTDAPVPHIRLLAAVGFVTILYNLLAEGLKNKTYSLEQAEEVTGIVGLLEPLAKDPPANFVDMLARMNSTLEILKSKTDLDQRFLPLIDEAQQCIHSIAFTPPLSTHREIKEINDDLNSFAAFVKEFKSETDRGAALVGAALVDNRLKRLLRSHFVNEKIADELFSHSAPLGSFSSRIDICFALGLITEVEHRECILIRKIRNDFAHMLHGLTFNNATVANRCRELKAMPYERWGSPRQRYINSVITLCMVLWHRPEHAANVKAQSRQWPWHLAFGKK